MILYTIVPPEVIFKEHFTQEQNYFEAEYRGEKVLVSKNSEHQYEIARLFSTSPGTYLKPDFQPGKIIHESDLKI